jgi:spoIIIJ-associated protein
MQIETKVDITFEKSENVINIELSGEEMGVLIGKRGNTLDSLQYLTSLYCNKLSTEYLRVKMDTENYRARRRETLEHLAHNIAHKVHKTKRPVYLEPMNPYERRIIHSALQNDRFVTTRSEGEEPYRKVVVVLKK